MLYYFYKWGETSMEIFIFSNICPQNSEKCLAQYFSLWYDMLDESKRLRYISAKSDKVKRQIVLSDMVARLVVSRGTGVPREKVVFSHSSHGKPFIANSDFHFNISHSGDYIVACADSDICGIDIEVPRAVNLKSAKRFCCAEELEYINNSKNRSSAFLYIWTRKEAYFKALGCGISAVMSSVNVLHEPYLHTIKTESYTLSVYSKNIERGIDTYAIVGKLCKKI